MLPGTLPLSRRLELKLLVAAALVLYVLTGCVTTTGAFETAMNGTADTIDLSHPLKPGMPAGPDGVPFQIVALKTVERDGVSISGFSMSETAGTNIEAPARTEVSTPTVDKLPLGLLMGYGVVVDVSKAVKQKADYQVSRSDIESWESDNGPIPAESIVLINTGWAERWPTPDRYLNVGADGKPAYPGISTEAVEFLVRERRVHALGIDTASLYAGCGNEPGQRGFLSTGKYHINNLVNLDQLPARGAYIMAFPLKIQGAAGSPARVLAIMPMKKNEVEPGKKKVQQETGGGMGGPNSNGQGPGGAGGTSGQHRPGGY